MLRVLSLAPVVLPGSPSPSGWRCSSGKSSLSVAGGFTSLHHLWAGPWGGLGEHRALCTSRVSVLRCLHGFSQQPRAEKARVTGTVGCSQHHLEAKSCWLLHPFIASLVIIRDAKAQTVASSLAVEHPHHSQVSPCPATTYSSSPSYRDSPSTTCCSCLARAELFRLRLEAVQVWVGTGQYWMSPCGGG